MEDIVEAFRSGNYHTAIMLIVLVLVIVIKRSPVLKDWIARIPDGYRWVLPVALGAAAGAIEAFQAGGNWIATLSGALFAVFGVSLPAMGLHAALRDWKFGDDATIGGHPSDPTPGAAKKSVPTISPRSGVASLVVLGMLSSACASVFPTVAKTNAQLTNVIVDAELALDIADDTVAAFAFAHDVPEQLLRQYADASAEARRALAAARTALLGVRRLTQKQYDEAFQDFERAWADVERAIAAIRERVGASNTRLRDPIALDYGVR